MATVYKAYDTRLETDVAVKVIRTENILPSALERTLKRFEREAKALARLTHPNIVKVTDFGEDEGKPYLVMPYLPGGTLKHKLGKPIPWAEAVKLLFPIAEALEYAHSQNMIHRDVKPSNILLTQSGKPMLTDFGIAKILDLEETADLTGTGMVIGTPEYMAPEQWTGKTSTQSDQYALGVVLYEMLTGRKPYTADTPAAVLIKQTNEPLPRPGHYAPNLPGKVEKLLLKALAKNPADRYATMGDFANAMESLLRGTTALVKKEPERPRGGASDTLETVDQDLEDSTIKEQFPPHTRHSQPIPAASPSLLRYWPVALGGVGCLLGLIVLLFIVSKLTTTIVDLLPNAIIPVTVATLPRTTIPATIALSPSPTTPPTSTQECNKAQFITDISVPDGTLMSPGQAFTKTWRIKNIGTCTWAGYSLVFDSGNSMGGAVASDIGNTPPGGTIDLSINLTAPTSAGNYRGYWSIRSTSGTLLPVINGYQIKSFYVDIKVSAASVSVTLAYLSGESGLVTSGGAINNLTVAAGDSMGNQGVEAFLSFEMTGVPAGATIQSASLTLIGGGQVRNNPFAGLGCLSAYLDDFGSVDPIDFVPPGATGGFANWCNAASVSSPFSGANLIAAIQARVGTPRFRFRLQFKDTLTDGNGTIDDVLIIAPVTLVITYLP
jgi:serine/threonine protein kinase